MSFIVTFLTPGGAEGSAVWRANPTTCPVQCPADYTCGPARAMSPGGKALASMGIDLGLGYLLADGFLRTGWSLPFTGDRLPRTGSVTDSGADIADKTTQAGNLRQASCK
jgi:hypothetical protein